MKRKVHLIIGGPGTGKTQHLLSVLESLLVSGVSTKNMAYVSFTRRGAYAGVDRAKSMFDLSDEDCMYFKTLHSIAFHLLGVNRNSFITGHEMQAAQRVLDMSGGHWEKVLQFSNRTRNTYEDIDEDMEESATTKYGAKVYAQMLSKTKKKDFTSLLEEVCRQNIHVNEITHVMVDEAQDLTPLHWRTLYTLFPNMTEIWIAGDPNQCIYEWTGASSEYLLDMNYTDVVNLDTNHRCDSGIWRIAQSLHAKMHKSASLPPTLVSENEGEVYISNTDYIDLERVSYLLKKGGSVGLLAHLKDQLQYYVPVLVNMGIPFTARGSTANLYTLSTRLWNRLEFLRDTYYVGKMTGTTATFKDIEPTYPDDPKDPYGVRAVHFGHLTKEEADMLMFRTAVAICNKSLYSNVPGWQKSLMVHAFVNNKMHEVSFNRVTLSTVHAIKGEEYDSVAYCDKASKIAMNKNTSEDGLLEELHIAFVAVTRAKHTLYVWHASKDAAYSLIKPEMYNAPMNVFPKVSLINYPDYVQEQDNIWREEDDDRASRIKH